MCQPMLHEEQQANTTAKKMAEEEPTNPILVHWLGMYRSMPTIYFPYTTLNISFTLFSAIFLYAVRLTIKMTLIKVVGWVPEDADGMANQVEATGCLTAALHALTLVPGLFVALTTQPYRITANLNTAPQWWQDLVHSLFQLCTGYMIYDSIASFIIGKGISNIGGSDYLFLGHHVATAVYMTQCRVLQAGHTSAMICMFLGEFTNPFQNGHAALGHAIKNACCNGPLMVSLHKGIELCFALSYFGIRAIIAPVFFAHVTFQLLFESTRRNIPLGVRIVWIILIWAVEVGSYAWIVDCGRLVQARLGLETGESPSAGSEL